MIVIYYVAPIYNIAEFFKSCSGSADNLAVYRDSGPNSSSCNGVVFSQLEADTRSRLVEAGEVNG